MTDPNCAALSQPEPAGLSDEELLQIAAKTIKPYEDCGIGIDEYEAETECAVEAYGSELIAFARAVEAADRAQRQPVPPQPGEVQELVKWLREQEGWMGKRAIYSRIANLLSQRHPQPVPVSERPWEREGWCDEQGKCWWFNPGQPAMSNPHIATSSWRLCRMLNGKPMGAYSLPAHALPLPSKKND